MLSPPTEPREVRSLRIVERVEGFLLQRFDARGDRLGEDQFDTLDEAMHHVYTTYESISDWSFCPDDA